MYICTDKRIQCKKKENVNQTPKEDKEKVIGFDHMPPYRLHTLKKDICFELNSIKEEYEEKMSAFGLSDAFTFTQESKK